MTILQSMVSAAGRAIPTTRAQRLLILNYHRVHSVPDPMFPGEVDTVCFDWQMRALKRHCSPLPLVEALELMAREQLPPRAVAITFDDGYADNVNVALPILLRHRLNATFFIATGFLDGGRMWNDSIIEAVRRSPMGPMSREEFGLGPVHLADESTRGEVAEEIIRAVKHRLLAERAALVDRFCARLAVTLPDDLMMTSAEVSGLVEAGMAVGAHTVNHPILRVLQKEEAAIEIESGRKRLQQLTGRAVRVFAYPNGKPGDDYGRRERELVRDLGFEWAVATWWGAASSRSDRFALPRFTPWGPSPHRWLARLLFAFSMPDQVTTAESS